MARSLVFGHEYLTFDGPEKAGEHGFTWSDIDLLRDEAANYGIKARTEVDIELRLAYLRREEILDILTKRIIPFLPPREK